MKKLLTIVALGLGFLFVSSTAEAGPRFRFSNPHHNYHNYQGHREYHRRQNHRDFHHFSNPYNNPYHRYDHYGLHRRQNHERFHDYQNHRRYHRPYLYFRIR